MLPVYMFPSTSMYEVFCCKMALDWSITLSLVSVSEMAERELTNYC